MRKKFLLRHIPIWSTLTVAALLLFWIGGASRNLQTLAEWPAYEAFAVFNAAPTCLVRSALYIRDQGRPDLSVQDSHFDPILLISAMAERQAYVSSSRFGGKLKLAAQRMSEVRAMQSTSSPAAMAAWAREHRVGWYLMRPEDSQGWSTDHLEHAAFRCEDFRVFRLG